MSMWKMRNAGNINFFKVSCNRIKILIVLLIETKLMTQETFKNTVFILKDEMYRFAKRFVMSSDEAEDVVQDLMIKFWQKKEELEKFGNLKSYALKSVRNECLNRLKHHDVKLGFADLQLHRSELYSMDINNMKDYIIGFINQLPEKQKMVIHLKDVEEYEVSEISEMLDMEENAVRVNLMRARQKVKEQISQLMSYEQRSISE
ncbi:RNA polymerase sigma factor [Chryseobacterium carnipullorum]|uniref:RNA polymerase sigma factor n=2 Tax=Chryseobacterium carnipullorum TaxID=1124835 RepID=A0A376DLR8_CHRCU|nr:RNA polymerase sigma factor [Chryseobacterium carnipullorum]